MGKDNVGSYLIFNMIIKLLDRSNIILYIPISNIKVC
jgi:hypothetical protein